MKIADLQVFSVRCCELVDLLFSQHLSVEPSQAKSNASILTSPSACQGGGGPQFKYDCFGGSWPERVENH